MRANALRSGLLAAVVVVGITGVCRFLRAPQPVEAAGPGWVSLFNGKNLDGWYSYFNSTGKKDPKGIFKVEKGLIHVLDIPVTKENQEFGYIATEKEFSNCRIHVEYKWGVKKFLPRADTKRDAGLLYWVVGPDKVWPRMVECQIQEGDTGDTWLVDDVSTTTTVSDVKNPKYAEKGENHIQKNGCVIKSSTSEKPGWNTVEVIIEGDSFVHIVNGTVNNRGWHTSAPDPSAPGGVVPLKSGKIALQAEGAEIYYRNIRVKPLK